MIDEGERSGGRRVEERNDNGKLYIYTRKSVLCRFTIRESADARR